MNGQALANTVSVDDELRDIHGYQTIIIPEWLWWFLSFVALVIIAYFLYKYFSSRAKEKELTVLEKTLISLNNLDVNQDSKSFYLQYGDVVRSYLLNRVNINLFDKTLGESKDLLFQETLLDSSNKNKLLSIFESADMAKFAKQKYPTEKLLKDIANTRTIIEEVEASLDTAQEDKK